MILTKLNQIKVNKSKQVTCDVWRVTSKAVICDWCSRIIRMVSGGQYSCGSQTRAPGRGENKNADFHLPVP